MTDLPNTFGLVSIKAKKNRPVYRVYYGKPIYKRPGRPYKEFDDLNKARAWLAQNHVATETKLPEYIYSNGKEIGTMWLEKEYGGMRNIITWLPKKPTKYGYYVVDPLTGRLVGYFDDDANKIRRL